LNVKLSDLILPSTSSTRDVHSLLGVTNETALYVDSSVNVGNPPPYVGRTLVVFHSA
jgi:hypothetical protein